MDDGKRAALITKSASAARALVDDLDYVRRLLANPGLTRGDVRRLAHIARRLLVDNGQGDLVLVAGPRIGRAMINAPDGGGLRAFQEAYSGLIFFVSGGAEIATIEARWIMLAEGGGPPPIEAIRQASRGRRDFRPDKFLDEPVAFYRGTWCTRREVIQFVANIGSGVHSGLPATPTEVALDALSQQTNVGLQIIEIPSAIELPRQVACDGVSYEMLCALSFLVNSSDVQRLEANIREHG